MGKSDVETSSSSNNQRDKNNTVKDERGQGRGLGGRGWCGRGNIISGIIS